MPVSAEMAAILAEMKALNDSFLPDRSTNSRTGATRDVRVSRDTGRVRIPGMTPFLPLPRWFLDFTDDMDVKAKDTETITGEAPGVYGVLEVIDPASLSFATTCIAVFIRNADGSFAFPTNQTVTFRRAAVPSQTITASVWIERATDDDIRLYSLDPKYRWKVFFDAALRYPDTTAISANDQIVWSGLSAPGFEAISRPIVDYGPIGYACAYFKESP